MVSGRDGFLLFIGGLDMIFGNLLVIFGKDAYTVANATANDHAARGAPMWTGVGVSPTSSPRLCRAVTRLTALSPWYWIFCISKYTYTHLKRGGYFSKFTSS